MVNFAFKFSHFRYNGNWGRSDVNFNDTSKLLDHENPLYGATFTALSLISVSYTHLTLPTKRIV